MAYVAEEHYLRLSIAKSHYLFLTLFWKPLYPVIWNVLSKDSESGSIENSNTDTNQYI